MSSSDVARNGASSELARSDECKTYLLGLRSLLSCLISFWMRILAHGRRLSDPREDACAS